MSIEGRITEEFQHRFGGRPAFTVRSPGRVNLLGDHTDYNDGFVLPMAIDRWVWIALQPTTDRRVTVYSLDFGDTAEFALDRLRPVTPGWPEYLKGVAWTLQEAGHTLAGWRGVIAGNIPLGAGLASSAALEMAVARAFAAVSDMPWDPVAMARLGQRAESQWVGVSCGIMDQLISACGREGHALLIDCRSLEMQPIPLPAGVTVVVLDTTTRRDLIDSAYNERRAQCEAAASHFGAPALRDVSLTQLESQFHTLEEPIGLRARHVVSENLRTLKAAEAMRRDDAAAFGKLMNASHTSLRDDFRVSSRALDLLSASARQQTGCYGARMTGAGFGGCAVALVETDMVADFAEKVSSSFRAAINLTPVFHVCQPTRGSELLRL
ncbi:MAG: galactokinase [Candidatus Eisenbacteria sp.]|nr:galactokinase [Candidatus Eisenbacteria bacterium]